jgi:hypothetical protein
MGFTSGEMGAIAKKKLELKKRKNNSVHQTRIANISS